MSDIEYFFKESRPKSRKVVVSKRFKDKEGKPIEWELRCASGKTMERIKHETGFYNATQDALMGKFALQAAAVSVAYPNLRDAKLQDSYGVKNAEDLLCEMLTPAELDGLKVVIFELYGYDEDIDTLAQKVKNS